MIYYLVDRDDLWVEKWSSKKEMLIFLQGGDYLLSKCCHSWNDKSVTHRYKMGETYTTPFIEPFEFMIKDQYNRTVNLGDLKGELTRLPEQKEPVYRGYYSGPHNENWWEDYPYYILLHKRTQGRSEWLGYNSRQINTQQERQMSCDPMHKPYVRPKRNKHMLDPYGWAESRVGISVTWKQLKIRKQWQEKLM